MYLQAFCIRALSNQEISDSHSTGGQDKVVSMLFSSDDSSYARFCARNGAQKLSRQRASCQLHNLGSLWTLHTDSPPELGRTMSKTYAQLCCVYLLPDKFPWHDFGNVKRLEKPGMIWGYSWSTVRSYNRHKTLPIHILPEIQALRNVFRLKNEELEITGRAQMLRCKISFSVCAEITAKWLIYTKYLEFSCKLSFYNYRRKVNEIITCTFSMPF